MRVFTARTILLLALVPACIASAQSNSDRLRHEIKAVEGVVAHPGQSGFSDRGAG
jgi:hypothetical protein